MEDKGLKYVRYLIILALVLFTFIISVSITSGDKTISEMFRAIGPQIMFFAVPFLVLFYKDISNVAIAFNSKTNVKSVLWGIIIGVGYIIVLKLMPGLAIGVPLLPGAISDSMKFFIIGFVAPIGETIFFLVFILAVARKLTGGKLALAVIIQALVFSLFHLGAYVYGFYDLSSISMAFSVFSQNLSVFFSAFLFGIVSGFLAVSKGFRNILIALVMHMVINLSFLFKFAITN